MPSRSSSPLRRSRAYPPAAGSSWGPAWVALTVWLHDWWRLVHLGAVLMVLVLTPSSYRGPHRAQLGRHIYANTAPIMLGFSLVCALLTVVLTHIVLTTALGYGLTHFALQVVIRVLVLELIPLTAAMFVALRCTFPDGAEIAAMQQGGELARLRRVGQEPLRREVLPRVVAGIVAGITLAVLSSVVALMVTYLARYGFTVSGLPAYARMFGQVFTPVVCLILVLKCLLFSMVVALVPMASALYGTRGLHGQAARTSTELHAMVRMFALLLLIEVMSLVGNYY